MFADLLSFLILFSFDKSQFFFFEPIGVNLSFNWGLFLSRSYGEINTFALIVLSQSHFLGFFRFLFWLNSLSSLFYWSGSSNLFWFFEFFFVEFILNVSYVSSSLSWSVLSSSSTSSIEWMAFRDTLEWSSGFVVVSDLFSIISDSNWDISVDYFSCFRSFCSSEFFQLSSLLVS